MASTYFNPKTWGRRDKSKERTEDSKGKEAEESKNQETGESTAQKAEESKPQESKDDTAQEPILKPEDEKLLKEHICGDAATEQSAVDVPPTNISDDGEEKPVTQEEQEKLGNSADTAVLPETQPAGANEAQEGEKSYDDAMKEKAAERVKARKDKKHRSMDLPSQEEAEAATRGYHQQAPQDSERPQSGQSERRTWTTFLSTFGPKKPKVQKSAFTQPQVYSTPEQREAEEAKADSSNQQEEDKTGSDTKQDAPANADQATSDSPTASSKRPWSSYVPTVPSYAAIRVPDSWKTKSKDDRPATPVYNEDGSINEDETRKNEEREVGVLLNNLNMSAFNNRVFALTEDTQQIYDRFAQVLKDTINGGPTAYEDMEKLMRDAGPQLEAQFKNMPPFVQTLVKSLPARLGSTLGPEMLAAASEKPGADMKARMEAASRPQTDAAGSFGTASASTEGGETEKDSEGKTKKKRTIPGMKSLISKEGAVANMLRSVVNFLTTRFPFLASTTNVVMSLAVFILMFVFWYCHKRGKEMRLAAQAAEAGEDQEGFVEEVEVTDEDDADDEGVEAEKEADPENDAEIAKDIDEKEQALSQPNPAEVPLPDPSEKPETTKEDKGDEA